MNTSTISGAGLLAAAALLVSAGAARAQGPTITAVSPAANAVGVPRSGPLTVSFSQPLTAGAGALKVFSSQRGGLRTAAAPAVVSGNTLGFAPTAYPFLPGETVQYTVTTAATGSGGALARPRVGQLTAAVGGTGRGSFQPGSDLLATGPGTGIAVGDVDGDGDLDLVLPVFGAVNMRLNDGTGTFGPGLNVLLNNNCLGVALGDVDNDGDLDLLAAITGASVAGTTVSVRLNNGLGVFSGSQDVPVGISPKSVALGDVDGDGDLDFVTADAGDGNTPGTTASVRLNNGSGVFSGTQAVAVGRGPATVVLGDVDGDGDLDLATANEFGSSVSVRLNNGSGLFSGTQDVSTIANSACVAMADVDGDGDLDLLATNATSAGTVSVRLNNGSGIFSGSQEVAVGRFPFSLAVGDVDSDGDLDLLVDNYFATPSTVSVRLNNGSGVFSSTQDVAIGLNSRGLTLGDVDNDGDLDLLTSSELNPLVSVRLNGGTVLATAAPLSTASLTVYPNPVAAAGTVACTGAAPGVPVTVFDALGRAVLTATTDAAGAATLALPGGLAAGVYIVRVLTADGVLTQRVVRQ